jgi:photosystem II stability/assembly factor-like uncharacterized protein
MTSTGIYNIVKNNVLASVWTQRTQVSGGWNIASSADGLKLVVAVESNPGYIYRSIDSGVTWSQNASIPYVNRPSVGSSGDGRIILVSSRNGPLYVSMDAGATWTERGPTKDWYKTRVSYYGNVMVACPTSGSDGFLYVSTNSGVTWNAKITDAARNWYIAAAFSLDGSRIIVPAQNNPIFISTDSGNTWTQRSPATGNWNGVCTSSFDGTKLAACDQGGAIWISTDSGVNWTSRASSRSWSGVVLSSDGTILAASEFGGSIWISTDSGVSWTAKAVSTGWNFIAGSSDLSVIVATPNNAPIYTGTCISLVDIVTKLQPYTTGTQVTTGIYTNNSFVYKQNTTITTKYFTDVARNWSTYCINSYGNKIVAAVSLGYIYISVNSGNTWSVVMTDTARGWSKMNNSYDGSVIAAAVSGGNIYISRNKGIITYQFSI